MFLCLHQNQLLFCLKDFFNFQKDCEVIKKMVNNDRSYNNETYKKAIRNTIKNQLRNRMLSYYKIVSNETIFLSASTMVERERPTKIRANSRSSLMTTPTPYNQLLLSLGVAELCVENRRKSSGIRIRVTMYICIID